MALAVARIPSAARIPLALVSAIPARPASREGETRRPRRLSPPAASLPTQSRIVLHGNTVLFR